MTTSFWIFGYGSLVWRPDFPHAERRPAAIIGWARRFWQGSTDHRGVPGAPGRVVTLVEAMDEVCWGMAFRVEAENRAEVMRNLDFREKGGYSLREVTLRFQDTAFASEAGLVYIATPDNPNYLGPAPVTEIAAQIVRSRGPSGPNLEYVLRLAETLRQFGVDDPHVFALAEAVSSLEDTRIDA